MASYFYKILEQPPPNPLPEKLPATELDAHDGFIHLSTAQQIPTTADLFFGDYTTIYLLQVIVQHLDGKIQYAEAAGPGCPHLHDSIKGLGKSNVEAVLTITKDGYPSWKDVPAIQELKT